MPDSTCSRRSVLKMGLSMAIAGFPRKVAPPGLFRRSGAKERPLALLAIQLQGGNDALNTVVPAHAAWYRELRGEQALSSPEPLLPLHSKLYLNSSLSALAQRFREGQVAIFLGAGIPGQTKSHSLASEKTGSEIFSSLSVAGSLPIARIGLDGFDTHCRQRPGHDRLLRELDRLVERERARSDRDNRGRRLVTLVYSEFGRSVTVNDEEGTDHGVGGCAFLIGDSIRGGIYGDYRLLEPGAPGASGRDLAICFDLRDITRALRAESERLHGN
ncbi:MAG: DUF1501 domain-containing protein [Candidatus Melainabacteria bacterium]|nr:DUF1501 domain-containing protein [Candidatus Melainabacteria bacterium]